MVEEFFVPTRTHSGQAVKQLQEQWRHSVATCSGAAVAAAGATILLLCCRCGCYCRPDTGRHTNSADAAATA